MNPFLLDAVNGISYLERYFEYLEREVTALLDGAAFAQSNPAPMLAASA